MDYFRPHLRDSLLLDYFWHHLRDSLPRWTISDLIYGIRYLVELFKTSFTGFVISLNYFGPPLRDSLPHWSILDLICWIRYLIELFHIWFGDSLPRCSISDLICGIRYLVKLFQTSFTEFVTSLYYFRPCLRDLLSQWTISDLIYGIRYLNLTQAHRAIWYFIYTYFLRHYANLFYLRTFVYTIHYLKVSLNTSLRNFGTKLNDYWPRCDIFTWIIVCDL